MMTAMMKQTARDLIKNYVIVFSVDKDLFFTVHVGLFFLFRVT